MATRKKTNKKVVKRAGCLSLCILAVLLIVIPCFFIYRCTRSYLETPAEPAVSPADSIYHARLDTLIAQQIHIDKDLLGISVYDLTSDCPVYNYQDSLLLTPASCLKLLTCGAALKYLGADYSFNDSLFIHGTIKENTLKGDLILKGDFDPLMNSFDTLLISLKDRGIKQIDGEIRYDLPQRSPIEYNDAWQPWDIKKRRLPLMLKDENIIRNFFRYQLKQMGIKHTGEEISGSVPAGSECISVVGHNIRQILKPMLLFSSNIMAETIYGRLCECGEGHDILYRFVNEELKLPNEDCVLDDGSGLSPNNRVSARLFVALLRYLYKDETYRQILLESLPIPGSEQQRGSIQYRMAKGNAKERIYAKTGTLNSQGASSLSGFCQGLYRHWYAFSIINNNTPIMEGRIFQDKLCEELTKPVEDDGTND